MYRADLSFQTQKINVLTHTNVDIGSSGYSQTCLKWTLSKTKIGFQDQLSPNAGHGIAECSKWNVKQCCCNFHSFMLQSIFSIRRQTCSLYFEYFQLF